MSPEERTRAQGLALSMGWEEMGVDLWGKAGDGCLSLEAISSIYAKARGEGVSGSIPRVLVPLPPNSPISTERALKQVLKLLEGIEGVEDWVQASIDDVTVMLKCIK